MFSYTGRKWHWFDYGIVFLRLIWYLMNLFIIISSTTIQLNHYWIAALFTVAYLVPQLFHLPNRIFSFGFILSELVLTGSLFVWLSGFSAYVIDVMWMAILSIAFLSTKKTQWLALIGFLLFPVCIIIFGTLTSQLVISYVLALILFGTLGLALRLLLEKNEEQKSLLKELNVKNQQLVQLSSEIEYLTLKEERNRIASELHDAIGHTFTTTIVGVDALSRMIDGNPEAAKDQARAVSDYARESLEEIRKYVHGLPLKEEISIVYALEKVIASFNETTGMQVEFESDGEEMHVLPKQYTIFFIRCLQESLTNALKHGQATKIFVKLEHDVKLVRLTVKDNGAGKENLNLGFGLSTMKQRIEELGGTFRIESGKRGTAIELETAL